MLRVIATLLFVAQMTTLAGPGLFELPGGPHTMVCQEVTAHLHDPVVDAPSDCQGCDLSECQSMQGCVGTAVAITNKLSVTFLPRLSQTLKIEPAALHGVATDLLLPPPRA